MKKTILSMLFMLVSICAMAGSDLKITSGDKKFFKGAEGNAVLEMVWTDATYDGKEPVEKKFGSEFANMKKVAEKGFVEAYNDKSKKIKITDNKSEAQYKYTFKVSKVDQYFKVMGFVSGNSTKVWGTITVTDIKTGAELVTIKVDEVDGGASIVPGEHWSDCFEEVAKQLSRMK